MSQAVPDASPGARAARRLIDRLVACSSPARELLDLALSESDGPGRDASGRRMCALTPTGAPFEASFSVGCSASDASTAVRFSAVAGARHPFFVSRLRVQGAVLLDAGRFLPAPAASTWASLTGPLLDAAFPDPARVPARTRLVGALGAALDPADGSLLGLRCYLNAGAVPGTCARLDAGFEPLARSLEAEGWPAHLVAIEVRRDGSVGRRLYAEARLDHGAARPAVCERLASAGLPATLLDAPVFVALAENGETTVHVPASVFVSCGIEPSSAVYRLADAVGAAGVLARWQDA
ncbi:MAG: hypothetical protein J2P57_06810, partial [Acidimicrobiaceae bacterium]|nr:hypothetical protein [Acidimicrobiaceae bacterium]